jgi:hypothetical protein
MKLTKLTPVQKARLKEIKEAFIKKALTFQEIDVKKSLKVIEFVYSLGKRAMPKVYQVSSPYAAQRLANELKGTKNKFYPFGTYLSIRYQSWYAYYDTFLEFGILPKEKFEKYYKLREITETGIYDTIEFQHAIIVCEKPVSCKKNEKGLHCIDGPAIKWRDGYEQYYVNGRAVEKAWSKKCIAGQVTQQEFIEEQNDEKRSAAYMFLGEQKMMNLLDASLIDEVLLTHANGESEKIGFYKTKKSLNKFKNKPYAWRKMTCPSTGTIYLTPTNPDLKTALEVAKFHRPEFVPTDINYSWISRS